MNITDARELIATLQAELVQFKGIFGDYDEPTRTYEQAEVMWNTLKAQLAALQKLNHPSCLLCGKTEPCMTDAEGVANGGPGKPCTFDMTPRQMYDWCVYLKKRVKKLEEALMAITRRVPIMGSKEEYRRGQSHALEACSIVAQQALAKGDAFHLFTHGTKPTQGFTSFMVPCCDKCGKTEDDPIHTKTGA